MPGPKRNNRTKTTQQKQQKKKRRVAIGASGPGKFKRKYTA